MGLFSRLRTRSASRHSDGVPAYEPDLLTVQVAERRIKRLDKLALERTYLANHRTLLAYWRTSFSIWLVALALFKFFEEPVFFYMGIGATLAGVTILFRGIRYYKKEKERIKNS
jgi:uncharacterized membrane protein YidH (DUF202 family)